MVLSTRCTTSLGLAPGLDLIVFVFGATRGSAVIVSAVTASVRPSATLVAEAAARTPSTATAVALVFVAGGVFAFVVFLVAVVVDLIFVALVFAVGFRTAIIASRRKKAPTEVRGAAKPADNVMSR